MSTSHLTRPTAAARAHPWIAGSLTIELALAFGIFIAMLLAVVDVSYVYFRQAAMQHAVREAARLATTGRILPAADDDHTLSTRVGSIVAKIRQQSGIDLDASAVEISAVTAAGVQRTGDAGGPGDVVTIGVRYDLPLLTPILGVFFPNGRYPLRISTSFKNEQF